MQVKLNVDEGFHHLNDIDKINLDEFKTLLPKHINITKYYEYKIN